MARTVRAIPYRTMGDVGGWRIISLQAGSVLAGLGIQKFDVILRVNGISLASPEELLGLYGKLPQAESVRVSLLRDGKVRDLDVHIVP